MTHSAATSSGPLLFLRFVQQALLWLPANGLCSNRGSPPFLCPTYTALTNSASITNSTRTFICTDHRLRVPHFSSLYFIKDCSHVLYPTELICHLESSFTLLPIFCSSSALSHHLQLHFFVVSYVLQLLPTKKLMCKLLSLHCAEQTYVPSDLTAKTLERPKS